RVALVSVDRSWIIFVFSPEFGVWSVLACRAGGGAFGPSTDRLGFVLRARQACSRRADTAFYMRRQWSTRVANRDESAPCEMRAGLYVQRTSVIRSGLIYRVYGGEGDPVGPGQPSYATLAVTRVEFSLALFRLNN